MKGPWTLVIGVPLMDHLPWLETGLCKTFMSVSHRYERVRTASEMQTSSKFSLHLEISCRWCSPDKWTLSFVMQNPYHSIVVRWVGLYKRSGGSLFRAWPITNPIRLVSPASRPVNRGEGDTLFSAKNYRRSGAYHYFG